MKIRIEPYKTWSGGARALGERAGILRATTKQVAKHGDFDIIINWGRSERRFNGQYINDPDNIVLASDKLQSFVALQAAEVPIPPFTTKVEDAQQWLDDGDHVVVRKMLRASAGRGIVLVGPTSSEMANVHVLPDAPLYVKYIKKATEYRVHVFDGEVIDVQQKRRRMEVPDDQVNWQIRNAHNGWVFARDGVERKPCVLDAAVRAVSALGLTFGACDIGYNAKRNEAVVYEVNTAPGLEGTTLDVYYEALRKKFPQINGGMYAKRRVR